MFNYRNMDRDLQYVCYMIERLGRRTHNHRKYIVNSIGKEKLMYMYRFANVMHCEIPEDVEEEFIQNSNIQEGDFDNTKDCKFIVPLTGAVGDTYMWLILNSLSYKCTWYNYEENTEHREDVIDKLIEVYNSWIVDVIDNYNTTMFTEDAQYIYKCYKASTIL